MNRYLRRLRRFGTTHADKRSQDEITNTEAELFGRPRPHDLWSARAKSSRHGKVTADKWNQ